MFTAVSYPTDQQEMYALLVKQAKALMEGERNPLPHMANLSALLYNALPEVNWVGFYLNMGQSLMLGPFSGNPACIRIQKGRGVCGTAWATMQTQRVDDVHSFPGHIACDSASQSELVIPLCHHGEVLAVLDIDSPKKNRFNQLDEENLTQLLKEFKLGCDLDFFHKVRE